MKSRFPKYEIRDTKYEILDLGSEQQATSNEPRATSVSSLATSNEPRATCVSSLATSDERRATVSGGFTLLEVIGVLAVMATLTAILLPNLIDQFDRAVQDAEAKNLQAIGQGVETYLVQNLDWPNSINQLSPEYVPFDGTQLQDNPRGYKRYLSIHPDATSYTNGQGIAPSDLTNFRFMVITDLTQNVNPNTNNAANFNSWWNTDDSINPDLLIHRVTIKPLLYLLSLSAVGVGGSVRIDGTTTNNVGNPSAPPYGQYHLKGTLVELSESAGFGSGSGVTITFTLTADAGYQWDPNCSAGTKWHVLGAKC